MPVVDVSPAARADIAKVLAWTQEHFGNDAAKRYEALLRQGLLDLARSPVRPGTTLRAELGRDIYTFYLTHSRTRADRPGRRVKRPRHFLVFRSVAEHDRIDVIRVLHETVDLPRHVPKESSE